MDHRNELIAGIVVLVIAVGLWLLPPIVQGYHFGCDVLAGDNQRTVRLGILFCRQASSSTPTLPYVGPNSPLSGTATAP